MYNKTTYKLNVKYLNTTECVLDMLSRICLVNEDLDFYHLMVLKDYCNISYSELEEIHDKILELFIRNGLVGKIDSCELEVRDNFIYLKEIEVKKLVNVWVMEVFDSFKLLQHTLKQQGNGYGQIPDDIVYTNLIDLTNHILHVVNRMIRDESFELDLSHILVDIISFESDPLESNIAPLIFRYAHDIKAFILAKETQDMIMNNLTVNTYSLDDFALETVKIGRLDIMCYAENTSN